MQTSVRLLFVFVSASLWVQNTFAQENWTRFHGPNGTGISEQADLPSNVDEDHILWKAELVGTGSSSPVVFDGKVFLTGFDSESKKLVVQCLDLSSGDKRWDFPIEFEGYRIHSRNSYASSTPAVDASHVYISHGSPEKVALLAINHDGEKIWERNLGTWQSQHGYSASPIVYKDKVILFDSQQAQRLRPGDKPGASRMIAVKANDGSDVWESQLTTTRACYAVPSVFTDAKGQDQLVSCNTGDGFFALNPETGKRLWSTLPFQKRTVASALVVDGLIIGSNGSGGGGNYLVAIRPDQSGEKDPEKAYEIQRANYVPSPVAVNDLLILFTDRGVGRCLELQSGKLVWEKRISNGFSGSPVAADGFVYVIDEDGTLHVIAAEKEFEQVASFDLGESSRATPAIAGKQMLLRTESNLIAVGKK